MSKPSNSSDPSDPVRSLAMARFFALVERIRLVLVEAFHYHMGWDPLAILIGFFLAGGGLALVFAFISNKFSPASYTLAEILFSIGILLFIAKCIYDFRAHPERSVIAKVHGVMGVFALVGTIGLFELYRPRKLTPSPTIKPGVALRAIIRLQNMPDKRRKYFLDTRMGKLSKARMSVYLDASNVFTLALIDSDGEPHLVQVATGIDGIPTNQFIYLGCDAGVDNQSTSLRVSVNGRQVGALDLPFPIDVGALDLSGASIGADLHRQNHGKFDLAEIKVYRRTRTIQEDTEEQRYFDQKYGKFIPYDGSNSSTLGDIESN